MAVVWLRWRAELRARWRALLVLLLVAGVGGGAALAAAAGARRTDLAVPRFVHYSLPEDGGFFYGSLFAPPVQPGAAGRSLSLPPAAQRVVDLPQVVAHYRSPYLYLTPDPTGRHALGTLNAIGVADRDLFRTVGRPMVLSGQLPDPDQPDEVIVNALTASERHLRVGSHLRLYAYTRAQFGGGQLTGDAPTASEVPRGPSFDVRVAAIVRFPEDVSAVLPLAAKLGVAYEGQQEVALTPAFLLRYAPALDMPVQAIPNINLIAIRLRHGAADWKAFSAAAERVGRGGITIGDPGNISGVPEAAASAQRGIRLEVIALLVFAALAAGLTLLVVGQSFARRSQLDRADDAVLRGFGVTGGQLAGNVLLRAVVVAVGGALVALVVAVAASSLLPFGLARQAELHPGVSFDPLVLLPGTAALALLLAAAGALPVRNVRRRPALGGADEPVRRTTWLDRALLRSALPPSATVGIRAAVRRERGTRSIPVVAATLTAALAVTTLVGALTFGSSLTRLTRTPAQQGWSWDVLVGNPNDEADRTHQIPPVLAHDRFVGGYSAMSILAGAGQGDISIEGVSLHTVLAIDPTRGSVQPTVLEGRAPRGTHEIVLGTDSLHALHRHLGDQVKVTTPMGPWTLRIVGRMIAPSVGDLFTNRLGEGGWVTGAMARAASGPPDPNGLPPTVFNIFAVRYAPGVSRSAAFADLQRHFGPEVLRQLPPEDVLNLRTVDRLPYVLAGLVVLLGTAMLANTLLTAIRRRRRDLAIMKSLGCTGRQVGSIVAWQATTSCAVALVVGLPLGVAGGRWAWQAVASGIGSASPSAVPLAAVAITALGTLVLGNLVAAWPARASRRIPPALAMRTE
jgi:ABC-type lipoprotein release transport system permease subunit